MVMNDGKSEDSLNLIIEYLFSSLVTMFEVLITQLF